MRKRIVIASIVLMLVASGAALAAALAGTKVTLHSTHLGKRLATSTGRTLYLSTADGRNKSNCTGACASIWPPLLTTGMPVAGAGVNKALLRSFKRGTKLQVSYNGHPLYRFASDSAAGQANGENVNGFFTVKASGVKG
jgi:predicted lipoprotein with Yx(FWY)xxD motif